MCGCRYLVDGLVADCSEVELGVVGEVKDGVGAVSDARLNVICLIVCTHCQLTRLT